MADFEFIIPLNRAELTTARSRHQYCVEDVLSSREIPIKLKDVKQSQHANGGVDFIVKNFDFFYSSLCEFGNINETVKSDIWDLVVKSIKKLEKHLVSVLDEEHLDASEKTKYLNILKMNIYVFTELVDCFETEVMKPSAIASKSKQKKKTKKSYDIINWDDDKENAINMLQQFFKLNIKKLWEPPVIEESFINLISNSCFKVLENPSTLRIKSLKDALIDLLALSLETSRNSLGLDWESGLSLKLIQMIQTHEHLVTPLVDAVEGFVTNHNAKNIVNVIIREIGIMEGAEGQDNQGIRSVCQFLTELGERLPDIVLLSITHLNTFLDHDAYTMRVCTLTIMGEIISKNLNKEGMDAKSKKLRDQFMDHLEMHLHDINAFARTKTLQVWQKLLVDGVIPLCRQQTLLQLISGRLLDKSSLVRKNAVFFITEFLKHNRLVAMLSLEDVENRFKEESRKLKEMMPDEEVIPLNLNADEDDWKDIEDKLKAALQNYEVPEDDSNFVMRDADEENQLIEYFEEIRRNLSNENYEDALQLFFKIKKDHNDNSVFMFTSEDPLEDESVSLSEMEQNIQILQKIYSKSYEKNVSNDLLVQPAAIMLNEESGNGNIVNDISKQQILVKWLQDCVLFSQQLCVILPRIVDMLSSSTQTDVLEAINFFVTAQELGVIGAVFGVKKFLPLIRSKEAAIKDAVVTAFKRLYLNPIPKAGRKKPEEIVFGLSLFLQVLSLSEIQALEELIGEWMLNDEIPKSVLQIMWQKFSKTTTDDDKESHLSLRLLGMAATTEPNVIKANLNHLIEVGLGERAENDFLFAKDVCLVLLKLNRSDKPKVESKTPALRYPKDHEMFENLLKILVAGLNKKDKFWTPFCQVAIKFIYKMAENPNKLCVNLVVELLNKIEAESEEEISVFLVSRVITLFGEIAINHLVYLDFYIFNELKRRAHHKDQRMQANEQRKKRRSALSKSMRESNAMDLELGLIGAEVDDTEADFIAKVCEEELLRDDGLLGICLPFVTEICANPVSYKDVSLRSASALALGKLMLISPTVCEKQLPLLVTILEKSVEPEIRADVIIILRDLSIRFPNLLDPWTAHLYGRLKDKNVDVRKNTLLVLKDLILNDLIKVKSHMSDIALCLVDNDQFISNSTNEFFVELSKRGNALYNVLPDIISHLSDPDVGTTEGNFKQILKTLLGLIEKDKQLEQLIEKLCLRFNSTRVERQDQDLAYCLSLLTFSERSLRKLQDNVTCYAEKLRDVNIYDFFSTVLNGARKNLAQKTGSTVLVDELSTLFEQFHLQGLDGNARKLLAERQNKGKPTKTPRKKSRKRKDLSSDSSDGENANNNRKPGFIKPRNPEPREIPKRTNRQKKTLQISFSSDSD